MKMNFNFVITKGLHAATEKNPKTAKAVINAYNRFCVNDWGNIPEEDKEANRQDLKDKDGHILARYTTPDGDIYINAELNPDIDGKYYACIMFCNEY